MDFSGRNFPSCAGSGWMCSRLPAITSTATRLPSSKETGPSGYFNPAATSTNSDCRKQNMICHLFHREWRIAGLHASADFFDGGGGAGNPHADCLEMPQGETGTVLLNRRQNAAGLVGLAGTAQGLRTQDQI